MNPWEMDWSGSGTPTASGVAPRLTTYSPQRGGDQMEGGYEAARPGPDGQAIVRTLEDFRTGASPYVTIAGNPKLYGRQYTVPEVSYAVGEQRYTLRDVPVVVHDTGGAFRDAPEGRFDVPVGRDLSPRDTNQGLSNVQIMPRAMAFTQEPRKPEGVQAIENAIHPVPEVDPVPSRPQGGSMPPIPQGQRYGVPSAMPWEMDWGTPENQFQAQGTSVPEQPNGPHVTAMGGYKPTADEVKRFQDLAGVGQRYDTQDMDQIREIDRQAQNVGALNAAAQGATFGLADEGRAALASATGESYDTVLAGEREGLRRYRRDSPIASAAAEIGGALVTAPFVPGLAAAKTAGVAGRMAAGAGTGAMFGAGYGFGAGEGGFTDRVSGAAGGAASGGLLGAAAPAIISGVGAAAKGINAAAGNPMAVVRGMINPEAEAGRRVGTALVRDNQTAGAPSAAANAAASEMQAMQAGGAPAVAADAGGEATRALARSAANTSPEGRAVLTNLTQDRFYGQGERASDLIKSQFGGTLNNVERITQLQEQSRRANRPLYDRAYKEGEAGIWGPEFEAFSQAPVVQEAIRKATKTGANRAVADGFPPPRNPFVDGPDGLSLRVDKSGTRAIPTLQFWDHVKRNMDDTIGALQRSGEKSAAADALALKGQLVAALDQAAPSYAQARGTAASFFGAQDAVEAGAKFATSRMRNDEVRPVLAKMGKAERELFAEGFATSLVNGIREARDRVNVISSTFGSEAARERIAMALGQSRAKEIEALVRAENVMDMLRTAVSGNSTTARQLTELGLAGGAGMFASGGNWQDPKALMTAAAVYGGRRLGAGVDQRVARKVAELLASSEPDALRKAAAAMAKSQPMLAALRTLERVVEKTIAPAGVNSEVAPRMIGMGRAEDDK